MKRFLMLVGVDIKSQKKWIESWEDKNYRVIEDNLSSLNSVFTEIDNAFCEVENVIYTGFNFGKRRKNILQYVRYSSPFSSRIELVFFPKQIKYCNEVEKLIIKDFNGFSTEYLEGLIDNFIIVGGTVGTRDIREIPQEYALYHQGVNIKETLGEHIETVISYLEKNGANNSLLTAGYYHDIGMPYSKSLDGTVANYHNHEKVSTYIWYCDNVNLDSLMIHYIAALIEYHNAKDLESGNLKNLNNYFSTHGKNFLLDLKLLIDADTYKENSFTKFIRILKQKINQPNITQEESKKWR